jgi:hypothetical protein
VSSLVGAERNILVIDRALFLVWMCVCLVYLSYAPPPLPQTEGALDAEASINVFNQLGDVTFGGMCACASRVVV